MLLLLVGQVFPYIALAIFLVGMVWRTRNWLKRPAPFPLTIGSSGKTPARRAAGVASELMFFPSLFRGDRVLWLTAWLMHVSLALVLIGHVVGIAFLSQQFCCFGASPSTSTHISETSALAGGLVLLASLLALLYRRTALPDVKRLSDPADFFDVLLLVTIAITGLHMRLVTEVDMTLIRDYMAGLLTFRPIPIPAEPIFVSHFTLVNVLLVYFPFSKLVHVTGSIVSRGLLAEPAPVYPTPSRQETRPS